MSKLHEIIEDQLAEAKAKAGQKIARNLSGGLRVELTCITSNVYLTLVRSDKYPSLEEWETITRHFPYQVPRVEPIRDHTGQNSGGRYTITARFTSQRTMQMKF